MIVLVAYALAGMVVAAAVNRYASRTYDRPLEPAESLMVWLVWPAAVLIVVAGAVEQLARAVLDLPARR